LYGMDIYAYYFDIPFEETVRRHNTRDKKQENRQVILRLKNQVVFSHIVTDMKMHLITIILIA